MTNVATVLLEIQAADIEILRAHKRLKELPEKAELLAVRTKIKEVTALKAKAEMLARKLEADLKARQDEGAMITDKLEVEQGKIMQTTDHRQVVALTREMDGLRRRADKLDMESMQYLERLEKAHSQLATIEDHLAGLALKDEALVTRYQAAGAEVQGLIAQSNARRAKLVSEISADVLKRYETVRDSKGGVGVGMLNGSGCTACHMDLPAERVMELKEGPDVGVCPHCRRLIVVRAEVAE
jgi:hypothetical protein